MKKIGLLPRILIALVLGIVCGLFFPPPLARVFVTFNGLFGNFLTFIIPLIIAALITPAIAELGRGAGKWLGITAGIAYTSTLMAGFLALLVGMTVFPQILSPENAPGTLGNPEDALLTPYFQVAMPPVFGVMTALVLSFSIGLGMTFVPSATLQRGFVEMRSIIEKVISGVILPLLPLYIFGIFLNMTVTGQVMSIIMTFLVVILVVFGLTLGLLLVQFVIAGAIAGKNPLRALATMLPAYATALGTSSSAATIPVTLRQAIKAGVNPPVASFVIPLCATIHLAGSTIKITAFSVAIMVFSGLPIDPIAMIGFVCMLGIAMIAAPGVPGGAIMTAAGLLSSMLGFNEAQVGLMIATYIAIDSFGTATNVTGDGAIALIVDRLSKGSIGQRASEKEEVADLA